MNQSELGLMVRKPTLCRALDMSPSGLEKLLAKDLTFPRPIKNGTSRQSGCYFLMEEVRAWLLTKVAARDGRDSDNE